MVALNKYASVIDALDQPLPTWVTDDYDQMRIAAYDGYDNMYKNAPGTFEIVMRGDNENPVYIPSAKRIVEATNRYLAKGWAWSVISRNPNTTAAEMEQGTVEIALESLFIREEFPAKFYSLKRNFLKRGDALFHITADASLPQGSRISITELDPRNYFRIPDPTNIEITRGCYIVELIMADDGKTQIAKRLHYERQPNGQIFVQLAFFESGAWDDRWTGHPPLKTVPIPVSYRTNPNFQPLLKGYMLDPRITALPVYHFRNFREGGEPFGTSEIAGVETLIAALNQAVSDEDITLALQGLGIYTTDSPRPVNEEGEETDWIVAPGMVVELKVGSKFDRVQGLTQLVPFQQHMDTLTGKMDESAGLSRVAVGNVDVQIAQSGVALKLDMAPILTKNEEKEIELRSRLDQLTFDLVHMWLPVYESFRVPDGILVTNTFGDPLPIDRAAVIKECTDLVTAGLMSRDFAIEYLQRKLGFQFPETMLTTIAQELDQVGRRLGLEDLSPQPGSEATLGGA